MSGVVGQPRVTADSLAILFQDGSGNPSVVTAFATGAVQTVKIAGYGVWKVSFGGHTTTALQAGARPDTVQAALEALPSIGSGNITVSGYDPYTFQFGGTFVDQAVAAVTLDTSGLDTTPTAPGSYAAGVTSAPTPTTHEDGSWTNGYSNTRLVATGAATHGIGANRHCWKFTGLAAGCYKIVTSWDAPPDGQSTQSASVPYRLWDGDWVGDTGTSTLARLSLVDQTVASYGEGPMGDGSTGQSLGVIYCGSGTITVVIADDTGDGGLICAGSACTLVGFNATSPTLQDTSTAGSNGYSTWAYSPGTGYNGTQAQYQWPGSGSAVGTWTFDGLLPGTYHLYGYWGAVSGYSLSNNSSAVPYSFYDGRAIGGTATSTFSVNQSVAPSGVVDPTGVTSDQFTSIGSITLTGDVATIKVQSVVSGGFAVFDTVCLVPVSQTTAVPVAVDGAVTVVVAGGPCTMAVNGGSPVTLPSADALWSANLAPSDAEGNGHTSYATPFLWWQLPSGVTVGASDSVTVSLPASVVTTAAGVVSAITTNFAATNRVGQGMSVVPSGTRTLKTGWNPTIADADDPGLGYADLCRGGLPWQSNGANASGSTQVDSNGCPLDAPTDYPYKTTLKTITNLAFKTDGVTPDPLSVAENLSSGTYTVTWKGSGNCQILQADCSGVVVNEILPANLAGQTDSPDYSVYSVRQYAVTVPYGSTTQTGSFTSGAATVTGLNTAGLAPGLYVYGTGIAAGAQIQSVDSSSQITLSQNATGNGPAVLTFTFLAGEFVLSATGTVTEVHCWVPGVATDGSVTFSPAMKAQLGAVRALRMVNLLPSTGAGLVEYGDWPPTTLRTFADSTQVEGWTVSQIDPYPVSGNPDGLNFVSGYYGLKITTSSAHGFSGTPRVHFFNGTRDEYVNGTANTPCNVDMGGTEVDLTYPFTFCLKVLDSTHLVIDVMYGSGPLTATINPTGWTILKVPSSSLPPIDVLSLRNLFPGAALWWCMPAAASVDCMTQTLQLIFNNLPSNCDLYLEYTNEHWNSAGGLDTFQWIYRQAAQAGILGGNGSPDFSSFYALKAAQLHQLAITTAAAMTPPWTGTIHRIFGGQWGNANGPTQAIVTYASTHDYNGVAEGSGGYLGPIAIDGLHIAPYWELGPCFQAGMEAVYDSLTIDQCMDLAQLYVETALTPAFASQVGANRTILNTGGYTTAQILYYEGGLSFAGFGGTDRFGSGNASADENRIDCRSQAVAFHSRAADLYTAAYYAHQSAGVALAVEFDQGTPWGNQGTPGIHGTLWAKYQGGLMVPGKGDGSDGLHDNNADFTGVPIPGPNLTAAVSVIGYAVNTFNPLTTVRKPAQMWFGGLGLGASGRARKTGPRS